MVDVKEWQVGDLVVNEQSLSAYRVYGSQDDKVFISNDGDWLNDYELKNYTAIERELAELKREKEEGFNLFGVEMD